LGIAVPAIRAGRPCEKEANRQGRPPRSFKLKEAIEGIAVQKPPLPVAAICRQVRRLAQELGEEPPSYWVVYRIVAALPADLVTLAHKGTKVYSNRFELVHRREADRPNAYGRQITRRSIFC
jgi:putative transposase